MNRLPPLSLRHVSSTIALAVALTVTPAAAQEAADQVVPSPQTVPEAVEPQQPLGPGSNTAGPRLAEAGGLEEIFVTAERREQSLQDVPISATIFSTNEIARRGIANVADIQLAAPSIAINTVNRSTFINIRGVGIAQSSPTSNPGVAYYIDGQLIPHEQFIGQSFYDIGSIEVLRGPQGTLTGQNSTGGAIYVRTPDPEFDAMSGYVEQTVGNYALFRTTAAINLPLAEWAALRIAGVHDQRDSFSRNIGPSGRTPGDYNQEAIRVNLALRSADDSLRVNLRGDYFDFESDNIAVKNRGDLIPALRNPAQPPINPRQGDPFVLREDGVSFLNQHGYRLSGEVRYDLADDLQVRGLTSWQWGTTRDQTDGDRGLAPAVPGNLPTTGANSARFPGRVSLGDTVFKTWINELNLISTGSGPFSWVLGAFSLSEDIPVALLRDNRSQLDFINSNSSIVTLAENTSYSVFGQGNWFVTDNLELLAGARHSWDKQVYTRFELPGPPLASPIVGQADSTAITGKIGLNYHLDSGTLLYLTASKGYKAGGVNLTPNTPNFIPEKNFVYELGFKSEFLNRHLRVNGDVFHSDYKDIQLNSLIEGFPLVQNAASGESWGAELEVVAQFDSLGFSFGAGYLDARFAQDVCINNTNAPGGTPALCPAGATASTADELVPQGRVLPLSPEWTLNAGLQYEYLLSNDWSLTPRVQWSYVSEQNATPFPSVLTEVPGRHLLDARLTLNMEMFRLEAYGSNLTGKTYIASQIQDTSSATGGFIFGAPRQYGVRGTVRF
jgi:iron complex outermembrane receptor protein